jgi:glycosyltransferase involved in cell wall biosynthesis
MSDTSRAAETPGSTSRYSLVIPVYRNEGTIPELLQALENLDAELSGRLEVVFVADGGSGRSAELLVTSLPNCRFQSQLLLHSRNFGSFPAIHSGLAHASGPYFAVMAVDLQEPPELMLDFFHCLESEPIDVTVGTRTGREDPLLSRWSSAVFWALYRRLVQPEMPAGGVDVFACNLQVRNHLLDLGEANSSLVGLLFWLGFRRREIPYQRLLRKHGSSAWTWSGKLRYLFDSAFSFSDLPIRLLVRGGASVS